MPPPVSATQNRPGPISGEPIVGPSDTPAATEGTLPELTDRSEPAPVCARPRAGSEVAAVDSLARELLRNGDDRLGQYLSSHWREVAILARSSPLQLETDVAEQLRYERGWGVLDLVGLGSSNDAGNAVAELRSFVHDHVRETIRNEARAHLQSLIAGVARTDIAGLTHRLQTATEGTPEHALAEELGLRGDASDVTRVAEAQQRSIRDLRAFQTHMAAGTWEPSDFPRMTERALCRLGLSGAREGSIAALELPHRRHIDHVGHNAVAWLDRYHVAEGFFHVLEHPGAATAAPFAVAVAGFMFAHAVSGATEENIQERRERARELGL